MRTNRHLTGAFSLALSLSLAVSAWGAARPDVQVQTSVSPSWVSPGGRVQYRIRISGPGAESLVPRLPDFAAAGFRRLPGQSSRMNLETDFDTGVIISERTIEYNLAAPAREGSHEIGPVRVTLPGGGTIQSNPVRVTVSTGPAPKPPPPKLGEEKIEWAQTQNPQVNEWLKGKLFLRPVIGKRRFYIGEQIALSYELYVARDRQARGFRIDLQPDRYKGFALEWIKQMDGRLRFRNERVGGQQFQVDTIESVLLTPTKSGSIAIPRVRMSCDVLIPTGSIIPQTISAVLIANPITIEVLPLPTKGRPEGYPSDYSYPVGDYEIAASLDHSEVTQYDLVTLRVRIAGDGRIKAVNGPTIPDIPGVLLSDQRTDLSGQPVPDTKTFEYIYRTTATGTLTFPPLEYAIFHPGEEVYKLLKTEPLTLNVLPAPESERPTIVAFNPSAAANGAGPSPVVEINRDIEYIRTRGFLRQGMTATPLYRSPGFLLFQLVPIGIIAVSYAIRRRRDKLEGDVALARRRTARSGANRRLRGARRQLAAGDRDAFFEELARALRRFIADQLNLSAAGMMTDRMAETLKDRGAGDSDVTEAVALLELCESARYAGSTSDENEMREAILRASQLIDRLTRSLMRKRRRQ